MEIPLAVILNSNTLVSLPSFHLKKVVSALGCFTVECLVSSHARSKEGIVPDGGFEVAAMPLQVYIEGMLNKKGTDGPVKKKGQLVELIHISPFKFTFIFL